MLSRSIGTFIIFNPSEWSAVLEDKSGVLLNVYMYTDGLRNVKLMVKKRKLMV